MKNFRRILSAFMTMLMVLSFFTLLNSYAYVNDSDMDFSYYINEDNEAVFTAYRGDEADLVIPETLGGYPVTAVSGGGIIEWGENVKTITLPSTVTEIHGGAFHCLNITHIKLNEGLKRIGIQAFSGCTQLESITLPESLESLGDGAFDSCKKLSSINIPEKLTILPDAVFNACNFESFEIPAHIRKVGSRLFSLNPDFREITVDEENPYYCAENGFLMNKEKTELLFAAPAFSQLKGQVPASVKKINEYAFVGCSSVDEIALPEGLEEIEANAFCGCGAETLTIPDSVTKIGTGAFSNCDNLEEVTIGDGLTVVEPFLFAYCDNLETVNFGSSVKTIEYEAFIDCSSLKTVNLNDGLEVIKQQVFRNCTNLEYLVMPSTVTEIENDLFRDCKKLINVTLSENLTAISQNCFSGCVELRWIDIPDSVTEIHPDAFYGCVDLREVNFGKGAISISDNAFSDCTSLTRITIPDNVTYISQYAIGYSTYLNSHMSREYVLCPWVIIYANKGSVAADYAREKGLLLGVLDNEIRPFSKGDVNGDGKISVQDATAIQKHLANLIDLEQIQKDAADVAGTPSLTIGDATAIQKYLAGITKEL
ncbi:MAG: leucine-rich repeat protein [Clostridia bacterium]|nr:leucine-rich repeat protein [Clostridia bacterium]